MDRLEHDSSPILFNLVLWRLKNIKVSENYNKPLQIMSFADDVVILGRSKQEIGASYAALWQETRSPLFEEALLKQMLEKQNYWSQKKLNKSTHHAMTLL